MKKFTALFVVLVILSACLLSCDESSNNNETTITTDNTSSITSESTTANEETTGRKQIVIPVVSIDDIPAFVGGTKQVKYNCGDGNYMLYVYNVTSAEYNNYQTKLTSLGFTLKYSNEINKNIFFEYTKDVMSIYTYYCPATHDARIIISPIVDSYITNTDTTEKYDVLFSQIKINYTSVINGMSYVMRTEEGSFIVIDGGWSAQGEAKRIYDFMLEQNPTNTKPRIAAWILTHPHSDHIGAFSEFSSIYYDKVVLERVIYNFVNDDIMKLSDSKAMINDEKSYYKTIRSALTSTKKWGYTDIIKPHTGQVLDIDGVLLEILYTHEDVYPNEDSLLYMNGTSMAFKIAAAGMDIMILGDSTVTNLKSMSGRYGSALKSDIIQATHHGRTHGDIGTYSLIDADICMWPTSHASYNEYLTYAYNQWLINNISTHYISEDGTTILNLSKMNS